MDVAEILERMRQPLSGLEVNVTSEKAKGRPSGYDGIAVEYVVHGKGLSREKVEEAVRLSEEKYCMVGVTLSKATTITHTITIIED